MNKKPEKPEHPGSYIREHVIPSGMSVTDAAKRLVVGRPALSNLLNGKSSLSHDMAVKLEKSFGADRQKLLNLQAEFDFHKQRGKGKSVTARTYVPPFLTIKAKQIHNWANGNHDARHLLPVLLRKLVRSTGRELRRVDFPGYDNAERRGWDGLIEADAATPWVPEGKSGWEFGTSQKPNLKAEQDYANRLGSVFSVERSECTFVFVTPRNWPGKNDWARSKDKAGEWKAVRAFDASDLEQWLEESIPAQMWLAEQLDMPVSGFETLDRCWQRWEEASDPKMVPKIFEPSVTAYRDAFEIWLKKPSEKPFVVAADSKDEALAFLSCLFGGKDIATRWRDLAVVFKSAETLRTLAVSSSRFIPIVHTEEAERELTIVYRRFHCIVVRPRNAVDSKPDIDLDLLNDKDFENALTEMGIRSDEAERLARESGRSPTILRRRLSKIDAIRKPQWAGNAEIARNLIPMTLIGAWHATSEADCQIVSTLADQSYQRIEETVARLLQFDDCPVWSTGQYRGVASKIDALFAANKHVLEKDLTEFFWLAEYVLSESDPALDLPEDQRWAAGLYGKVRDHSAVLREGVCETLVILSVHGNDLFKNRLGIDVEGCVSILIRKLLTPLSLEKLLSHEKDIPHYAEAAPEEFLSLIEADLQQTNPTVLGLLKPAESGPFGSPRRCGLLWALECLAWKHLGRVSVVLAQLSKTVINDNWNNKPISSLQAIYRSWLPQTAASLEGRIRTLEMLTRQFPDIGWQICIAQWGADSQVAFPFYRPRWRSDASGAGRTVTCKEFNEFTLKTIDLVLAWPKYDQPMLSDLVERLTELPEEVRISVWDLIDAWAADSEIDETAKAALCEQIRQFAFTWRSRLEGLKDETKNRARVACKNLQPRDTVIRHSWLFAQHWVEASNDEIDDENFDHSKHQETIRKLRAVAMKEIWAKRGFEGVTDLLSRSNAPDTIGCFLEPCIEGTKARAALLQQCLSITGDLEKKIDGCINGFLSSCTAEACEETLMAAAESADADQIVRLFCYAPFHRDTWRLLERYGEEIPGRYWREILPQWRGHDERELNEIIDRLLEAKRPRAAFYAAWFNWDEVETARLKRLLLAVATVDADPADQYSLHSHDISAALDSLDGRTGVSPDEVAQLEFMFIMSLDPSEHGIPNLDRQIAKSPIVFVRVLALAFKRNDDGQDPPEWRIEEPERRGRVASACYRLLKRIKHIPGAGLDGKVDAEALFTWLTETQRLCAQYGRAEVGEQNIGQLLSKSPAEEDGSWPCLAVCKAMEKAASRQISKGFSMGVCNKRGAYRRGMDDGGAQELELAGKYRAWAERRAFDYPYVSSVLESVAAIYDREAEMEDNQRKIEKRLWR